MAAISRAAFDALVNSTLTTQITPDSITPTTLDDLFYALSESYYNKIDGIQVTGMTNMISGVANGQNLEIILSLIMTAIDSQTNNTDGMIPYNFRAEKKYEQTLPTSFGTGSSYIIPFEDDFTTPNFDTNNLFYRDKFVATIPMTKTFALEKVCLKQTSPDADTWKIQILVNNVEVAASANVNSGIIDDYDGNIAGTEGYVFPTLTKSIALNAGDVVTFKIFCVSKAAGGTSVKLRINHVAAGAPICSNA